MSSPVSTATTCPVSSLVMRPKPLGMPLLPPLLINGGCSKPLTKAASFVAVRAWVTGAARSAPPDSLGFSEATKPRAA